MESKKENKFSGGKRFGNTLPTPKNVCFYCSKSINDYSRTVDHLIPRCDGGILSNDNKVNSCRECNRLKANMHPEEFIKFLDSMIIFEQNRNKETVGYLKKIKSKTTKMIDARKTKKYHGLI